MSDLRFDPLNAHWVAIAENRSRRPYEFIQKESTRRGLVCPFCLGNESETPNPHLALSTSGQEMEWPPRNRDPWLVRVVPNKFPAILSHFSDTPSIDPANPYHQSNAPGVQEVVIQSHRHVASLGDLNDEELAASFVAYQKRVASALENESVKHVMLFKNCRAGAGASLEHVHSQLIGTPIVTGPVCDRARRAESWLNDKGQSLMESLVEWELKREVRVLAQTEHFHVFCPFASRFAYQIWIVPRDRKVNFTELPQSTRDELGHVCRAWIRRLESCLNQPAYNLLFHFAPREYQHSDHWYVEIFPRITMAAGMEWGTGCWISPISPESAAKQLATVKV